MNESLKNIALQSLKTAVSAAVNEVGDFLDTILDEPAKQALADTVDEFKTRITRTHETPEKKA